MKFRSYESKDFEKIRDILMETWNFHKDFPEIKDKKYLYNSFLEGCIYSSVYKEVVVDDSGEVLGAIMGVSKRDKKKLSLTFFNRILFYIKVVYYFLFNYIGRKGRVLKIGRSLSEAFKELYSDKDEFDSSIELLILSKKARGKGLGRRFINMFIDYCKSSKAKTIHLMTDRGCNFKFYDRLGFIRHKAVHNEYLAGAEHDTNAFTYIYYVK